MTLFPKQQTLLGTPLCSTMSVSSLAQTNAAASLKSKLTYTIRGNVYNKSRCKIKCIAG